MRHSIRAPCTLYSGPILRPLRGITDNCLSTMALARPNARILSRLSSTSQQLRMYSAPGEGTIPPSKKRYVPTSGTYPLGFKAGSAHVGVKASNTRFDDLCLVASDTPCSGAAVFTTNKFQAAPVTVSRAMLKKRKGSGVRAVVVNSGCANAVTGKGGIEDAVLMGEETDRCFIKDDNGEDDGEARRTVVMSTGVIGQRYVHPSGIYTALISDSTTSMIVHFEPTWPANVHPQPTNHQNHKQDTPRLLCPRLHPRPLARRRPCNLHNRHLPQTPLSNIHPPILLRRIPHRRHDERRRHDTPQHGNPPRHNMHRRTHRALTTPVHALSCN